MGEADAALMGGSDAGGAPSGPSVRVLGRTAIGAKAVSGAVKRRLLWALVAHSPDPVPTDVLRAVIWGVTPPEHWDPSLRTHIAQLRDLFDEAGARLTVSSTGGAYALSGEADAVDLLRFRSLAHRALHAGSAAERLASAVDALALWDRPAFEESGDLGLDAVVDRLLAQRSELLGVRARCIAELDGPAAVLAHAESLGERDRDDPALVEVVLDALMATGQALAAQRVLDHTGALIDARGALRGAPDDAAATAALAQRRRQLVSLTAASPELQAAVHVVPQPFRRADRIVGRAAELDAAGSSSGRRRRGVPRSGWCGVPRGSASHASSPRWLPSPTPGASRCSPAGARSTTARCGCSPRCWSRGPASGCTRRRPRRARRRAPDGTRRARRDGARAGHL